MNPHMNPFDRRRLRPREVTSPAKFFQGGRRPPRWPPGIPDPCYSHPRVVPSHNESELVCVPKR